MNDLDNLNGKEYFGGFDYFFFDSKLIDDLLGMEFCLGQPWWDHWLPFISIVKRHATKRMATPCAYHKSHKTNWSNESYIKNGKLAVSYLHKLFKDGYTNPILMDCLEQIGDTNNFFLLYIRILDFLRKHSTLIWFKDLDRKYFENEVEFLYDLLFKTESRWHHQRLALSRRCPYSVLRKMLDLLSGTLLLQCLRGKNP